MRSTTGRLGTLVLVLTACGARVDRGGDDHDGGAPDGATLEVAPAHAALTVTDGVAPTVPYTATLVRADGTRTDVTAATQFAVDDGLGAFAGATLTAAGLRAGRGTITATTSGLTASAEVEVSVHQHRIDPSVPGYAPALFASAAEDPQRAPSLVYPVTGTIVPPNLGVLDVHWSDSHGNDLFEIAVRSPYVELDTYSRVTSPANFVQLRAADWQLIGPSHRGADVTITVRGIDSRAATPAAGTSAPVTLAITSEDVRGGIYYWAASAQGLYRHDFADAEHAAERYLGPSDDGGRCVGCHALSRDGTRIAVTYGGGDGPSTILDVASRAAMLPDDGTALRSNFTSFFPDGQSFVATYQGALTWRDTATGAVRATLDTLGKAVHPDVSPQGDRIVWVRYTDGSDVFPSGPSEMFVQRFTGSGFDPPERLLSSPGAGLRYCYPTFSPDGAWILYDVVDGDCYDDDHAQLWVVRADGAQPPRRLTSADVTAGLTNSWARWAPFAQSTGPDHEPVFWFTISSKRAFGVRAGAGRPQLWMAPFFPARAAAGTDPSGPMFWLPFQDLATSNHIAQWTTQIIPVN